MTVHNYRSRQVHEILIGVNPSSGFRDMRSAKSGPNLCQIWQVFGPWASPYGANGQITMTVHNYRPRQFHGIWNGENPSSGYRDMGSASLAAAAHPPTRPPARTVTTIPLQPGGLRGKNEKLIILVIGLVEKFGRTVKQSGDLKTSSIPVPLQSLESQLSSLSLVVVLLILFICHVHSGSHQYSWFSRISSTVANW